MAIGDSLGLYLRFPPWRRGGGGTESSNFSSAGWFLWLLPRPSCPGLWLKGLVHKRHSLRSGNSKGLWSSVPRRAPNQMLVPHRAALGLLQGCLPLSPGAQAGFSRAFRVADQVLGVA